MVKITLLTLALLGVAGAAAFALEVGVGAFYAPAHVVGYVDEVREESNKQFSPRGLKGRLSVGVYEGLQATVGLGYNDLIYREAPITFPEIDYVLSIPTYLFTAGADYAFPLGPVRPYAGGGLAIARERAEAYGHTTTDWYPGVYVEGGARYSFVDRVAFEAGPRYTLLFDEPAVLFDGLHEWDFERSEHRTQLFELMVGINFYF
ncbi:MAG: outer membrane beta-barrel protein [Candidatus Coatesbacteria bacterium]|nr:MAG: outer membrane beta-barrel protein [Candidatus Coatesbacteria bacterium]